MQPDAAWLDVRDRLLLIKLKPNRGHNLSRAEAFSLESITALAWPNVPYEVEALMEDCHGEKVQALFDDKERSPADCRVIILTVTILPVST